MVNARKVSYDILYSVLEEKQFSHVKLQEAFRRNPDMDRRDRGFVEHLVRSTLEHLYEIDARIDHVSKTRVKKLRPQVRTILRMSVSQLCFSDSIPDSAVLNEAVKLTAKLGFSNLKGFVNGVLRSALREKEAGFQVEDSLAMRYSLPEWLSELFLSQFSPGETEEMLIAMSEPVKLSVYGNPMKGSGQALFNRLSEEGLEPAPLPYGIPGFYLNRISGLEKSESFKNGAYLIQDVSSMLEGMVVNAKKGQTIIDVCAAPGGKSIHAAIDMEDEGRVISCDLTGYKTGLIKENADRMQLNCLDIRVQDASVYDPSLEQKADIVIADLPCSGLGIMGRKPDIRYNMSKEDILSLAGLQRRILDNIVRYVKPGGRIVYSTCTLSREEDEENFAYLCEQHHFTRESLKAYLPKDLLAPHADEGYVKLIPGKHACDGFFVASAVKCEDE